MKTRTMPLALLLVCVFGGVVKADAPSGALNSDRYACWQMLPVTDPKLDEFRQRLDRLRHDDPNDPWTAIFSLYLAHRAHDAAGLLAAAGTPAPDAFPPVALQPALFDQRTASGQSPAQAGLDLLTGRSYQPLRALRDLDAGLTARAESLRNSGTGPDADALIACRDRLRQGYLAASRNVIDRLFALNLMGRTSEARSLAQEAARLKYLTDPQDLAVLLARLGPAEAWQRLVQPLLADEVAFVQHPPDLQSLRKTGAADMTVTAGSRSEQGRAVSYGGNVAVSAEALRITCDRLSIDFAADGSPALLTAAGTVRIRGVPGVKAVAARDATYNVNTGVFVFTGDVQMTTADGIKQFGACTLSASGKVKNVK